MLEKCTLSLLQVVDDLCYRWEDNSAADTCSETLELLMTHLCWAVDEPHQENTDQAPTYLGLTITGDHSMAGPWWNKSEELVESGQTWCVSCIWSWSRKCWVVFPSKNASRQSWHEECVTALKRWNLEFEMMIKCIGLSGWLGTFISDNIKNLNERKVLTAVAGSACYKTVFERNNEYLYQDLFLRYCVGDTPIDRKDLHQPHLNIIMHLVWLLGDTLY